MVDDDEEKQLRLELLAADLKLKRKQEFWETPRNIAILVGVSAAIAAAIGFWLGRQSAAPTPGSGLSPVMLGAFESMSRGQFIDVVQTTGIAVIAAMLVYVVVRLDRTLTGAAERIKDALAVQRGLMETIERVWARVEQIEQKVDERNAILPTAKLGLTLDEIRSRIDRLEGKE